jgi:glycosyltransferase 2 family protein
MNKKNTVVTSAVLVLFCGLVYLQIRTWKKFDWHTFWSTTDHIYWPYVLLAVLITWSLYALRAVRWKIFLKPLCETTSARLLGPQFIGFTGLALLGRPGEMIRPYLIARKENLTFSSQVAVWLVERIFDMASVAIMFVFWGFLGDPLWDDVRNTTLHHGRTLHVTVEWSAAFFLAGIVGLSVVAVVLRFSGEAVADYLAAKLEPRSPKLAHGVRSKLLAFTDGLKTIHDFASFVQLFLLSMSMWLLVAACYWLVLHAYGGKLALLGMPSILLLMVVSMFGSLIQLPGVGGGSQLATIALLNNVFHIDNEISVSCGMVLWAATFMSVIPVGLLVARREHVSLRAVAAAEEKAAAAMSE